MSVAQRLTIAVMLLGVVVSAGAASPWQAPEQRSQAVDDQLRAGPFGDVTVIGVPFSATATMSWHPPRHTVPLTATISYFRDGAGRVRVEQAFGTPHGATASSRRWRRAFVSPEPRSREVYLLTENGTTTVARGIASLIVGGYARLTLPVSDDCSVVSHDLGLVDTYLANIDAAQAEPFAERFTNGMKLWGARYRTTLPAGAFGLEQDVEATQERWVSPELLVLVHSRSEDRVAGTFEFRMSDVRRVEPPASLFMASVAPAGGQALTQHFRMSAHSAPPTSGPCSGALGEAGR